MHNFVWVKSEGQEIANFPASLAALREKSIKSTMHELKSSQQFTQYCVFDAHRQAYSLGIAQSQCPGIWTRSFGNAKQIANSREYDICVPGVKKL
jgi:hypothetical protein